MPELPEVETIKRDLQSKIAGLVIEDVHVWDRRVVRHASVRGFIDRLKGKTISRVIRRGKALVIELLTSAQPRRSVGPDGGFWVVQVMMTGQLIYVRPAGKMPHTRVTLALSNGWHLHYNDQRLFGRLQWVSDLDQISYFRSLGPEPLEPEFQADWLRQAMRGRNVAIKTLLMNSQFISGIGNIYASEILFACGVRPKRLARSLKEKEAAALYQAIGDVLRLAIEHRGTSMRNYRDSAGKKGGFMERIKVYGRGGEPCTRCRNPIAKIVLGGRSTFYCKECQR